MSSVCCNNERMQNYGMPMCWSYGALLLFAFIVLSFVSVSLSPSSDTEAALCVRWKPKAMWYERFFPKYLSSQQLEESWTALWFSSGLWWVTRERAEEIDVTDTTPLWSKTNIWTLTQTVDKHFHTLPAAPNFKYGQDTQRRFLSFPLCCSRRANADLLSESIWIQDDLCSGSGNDLWLFLLGGVVGSSGEQTAGRRAYICVKKYTGPDQAPRMQKSIVL